MDWAKELDKLIAEAGLTLKFGLEAQGHIPTIQKMLTEGHNWQEIGRVIGWDGATAKKFYGYYLEHSQKGK